MNHPPLIIGQAPARGNDGKPPFAGNSGARLAQLAGVGETGDALPEFFDLVNLNEKWPGKGKSGKGDAFNMDEARKNAKKIKWRLENEIDAGFVLLMGRKVERAMGWAGLEYLDTNHWLGHYIILFPHPSGVNPWWNDAQNYAAARAMIRWALHASK
jgi:uracil-DNA glycosylase